VTNCRHFSLNALKHIAGIALDKIDRGFSPQTDTRAMLRAADALQTKHHTGTLSIGDRVFDEAVVPLGHGVQSVMLLPSKETPDIALSIPKDIASLEITTTAGDKRSLLDFMLEQPKGAEAALATQQSAAR
jgi:hypothetical protein